MKKLFILLIVLFISCNAFADTYEAKYNTAQWLPVVVVDGTDGITPEIGIVYTGVTFWYKEGLSGTWTQLTLTATSCTATSGYWCEESATNAPGSYRIYVPATVVDTKGKLFYIVKGTGYKTYWGQVSITANTAAEDPIADILIDTADIQPKIGAPAGASVSADIAAVKGDTNNLAWGVYNIVDLTNEFGDQNPTTTSSDTDLTQTIDISNTMPQPIMYYPTTAELATQNVNCNVQGLRTTITAYNTTTKVITYEALPVAPDYRCRFRIY